MASRTELKFQQRLKTKPVSKTNSKNDKDLSIYIKKNNSFELSESQVENNDNSTNSDVEDIAGSTEVDIPEFANEKRIVERPTNNEEPLHIEVMCAQIIKKNSGTICIFCYRFIVLILLFIFAIYMTQIIYLLKRLQIQ
tara:strand:- start:543 stop:959 length:417 start_codon:yes stop_codon:yes gene_type:complete